MRREISEELQAHIEDHTADLTAEGIAPEVARAQAEAAFGDFDQIQRDVETLHSGLPVHPLTLLGWMSAVAIVGFFLARLIAGDTILGAQLLSFLLLALATTLVVLTLHINRWLLDFFGIAGFRGPLVAFCFTLVVGIGLTVSFDIDNFETIDQNVLLFALTLLVFSLLGDRLRLRAKGAVIQSVATIALIFSLLEESIFSIFGRARCLFLTPDQTDLVGVVAHCQQVTITNWVVFPAALAVIVGVPFTLYHVWKFVRSTIPRTVQKIVILAVCILSFVSVLFLRDLNNYGEIDIVFAQDEIYRIYWEELGRRPQKKDLEFYASTRAYNDLPAIRVTLRESAERRLKMNLVFQEELGRNATAEEVEVYASSDLTIDQIRQELQQ